MQIKARVHADYKVTTPFDNQVLKAMLPYRQQDFGSRSPIRPAEKNLTRSRGIASEPLAYTPPSPRSPLRSAS
jgi:hypothetical protein